VCNTSVTDNSSFFPIENYKFQAKSIIGGPAVSPASDGAIATASSTTTASTSSSTNCRNGDNNQGPSPVAVGAGIGVPLAILAIALASWALVERQKRKRGMGSMAYASAYGDTQPLPAGIISKRAEKAELVSLLFHIPRRACAPTVLSLLETFMLMKNPLRMQAAVGPRHNNGDANFGRHELQ
jgi:hypothetical protein